MHNLDYMILLLLGLNILFMGALWHMDVNHNLDKLGKTETQGIFKITPEKGYRYSQYILIASLLLIDVLFVLNTNYFKSWAAGSFGNFNSDRELLF